MKTDLLPETTGVRSSLLKKNAAGFPITDCNYQVATLPKFGGSCAHPKLASFRNISGEYFRTEARGEFQREFIAFGAMFVAAAIPVLSNAHALAQFLRSVGTL